MLGYTINGAGQELTAIFLRRPDGLWALDEDLAAWRIVQTGGRTTAFEGKTYVALSSLPGLKVEVDEAAQTVAITVPVELFVKQTIDANAVGVPKLSTSTPSAFLNYDVVAETGTGSTDMRGLFEVGASNDLGFALASFTVNSAFGGTTVTRLDTYVVRDNIENATRLTIGDAITPSSSWSRPIRFGGIKFGTEFGLRPGYITFPTADFQGRTVLPSSVEFYADGALRYRRTVERGAFAVDQAPIPSGAGLLTVVTRDVLGVERRTTTPYYISTNLLRAGLSRYSIEVGAERNDFGIDNLDYSRPFAAGLFRYGITNRLTIESRVEAGSLVRDAGVTLTTALPVVGELGGTVAASQTDDGFGFLWGASYLRSSQKWDFSASIQQTTRKFSQLGIRLPADLIRRQIQGNAGHTFGQWGRLGISLANLRTANRAETKVVSANYNVTLGRGYLDAFAVFADSNRGPSNSGLGIGFTLPLGARTSGRMGAELQNGRLAINADYRVSTPTDRGFGYGANVRFGKFGQQRADLTWIGDQGEVRVDASRFGNAAGVRVDARGGVALAEGSLFATRQLDGAFAIVDASGNAGVRVYQDNRPLTKTNARGLAIIPSLRPYEENAIRLAPDDMPIGTRVDADDIMVVPGYRNGVTARFEVRGGRPAIVVLKPPGKDDIPPGTAVSIDDGRERAFIGYDNTIFVSSAKPTMTVRVDLAGGACIATVTLPAEVIDLPQVGPVDCVPQGAAK